MQNIYDIAVIGAGPGGISAVVEARHLGMKNILMIEKGENHSETIRKFYKDKKRVDRDYKGQVIELKGSIDFEDGTKESTLDYFDKILENKEIEFFAKTEVESVIKNEDIFEISTSKDSFQARNVVIAIGKMGKPNKPDYKIPAKIKQLVNFNLDKCKEGEKILVVGGGNSAAEYVLDLCEKFDATLNYRRDSFVRLNDINENGLYKARDEGKLKLRLGVDIDGLEEEDGKVKVLFNDGENEIYDRVIYAIGGTTPVDFLKKCNINLDEKSNPIFDDDFQTDVLGQYVAGDIATARGGSIAMALNHSYKIIEHILKSK